MPETIYTLRIQGRPESGTRGGAAPSGPGDAAGLGEFADLVSSDLLAGVRVEAVRGGGVEEVEVAGDELVEVELEGGIRQWLTVEELAQASGAPASRGGIGGTVKDGVVNVPLVFRYDSPTRGLGGIALKALRVFGVKLPAGWLADLAASEIAERLEDRLQPGPGLYRCPDPRALGQRVERADQVPGGGPLLVFLHGTASSTSGSFGALTAEDEAQPAWRRLRKRYGERIFALQHRSLSRSPAENALELLELLPDSAELHLVSHSRGGLVGELLCRGSFADGRPAFTDDELQRFAHHEERAVLQTLSRRLGEKRPRVSRFVRVACPARGTTLASRRLDHYLSALLNAIGLVPALAASPGYQFVKAALLALAKKRADVDDLPGLEAMMPESALIAVLNLSAGRLDSDLSVIAGDIEGEGVLGHLKVWATDLFYRADHDLVVNTAAMSGGTPRVVGRARRSFHHGPEVNHFRYFTNPESRSRLMAVLGDGDDRLEGFEPLDVAAGTRGLFSRCRLCKTGAPEELSGHKPAVVVLPGIMGSALSVDGDPIWLNLLDIGFGRLGRLSADASGVNADQLLEGSYRRLLERLDESHEVLAFPYDWRRTLDQAADQLAAFLDRCLASTTQPVRLLAHSMGGLVVLRLATAERHQHLWRRLSSHDGFRFVMLGTPTRGSHSISSVLLGREKMVRMLATLDVHRGVTGILRIVGGFQGMLELLPASAGGDDGAAGGANLFDPATWHEFRSIAGEPVFVPDETVLAAAAAFRSSLDGAELPAEKVCYVAGRAPRTPKAVVVRGEGQNRRVVVLATNRGDGRVPWDTGIPDGVSTWYAEVSHGALADAPELFDALGELLESGATGRLPQEPPADVRGAAAERLIELPDEEPVLFPDELDLERVVLGALPATAQAPEAAHPLRVQVVYGSLVFASHPVLVGHYEGDVIRSGEKALDKRVMAGRLTQRRSLGLYPGAEGSGEAILDPADPHRGALVAGLGSVGEISPGRISAGVRRAVLEYAVQVAECASWTPERDGLRRCGVSALLIGTGAGTGIDVDDSLRAVVRGVSEAIDALGKSPLGDRVTVESLEILELYEHRAICAAEALLRLNDSSSPVRSVPLLALSELKRTDGGQDVVPCPGSEDWWRRIRITTIEAEGEAAGAGGLKFLTLTDRARAEERLVATQQRLVDGFVKRSIASAEWRRDQAETLFELLLPNEIKQYAPDRRDLILIVDEHSARFPWELLSDGLGGADEEPLAVRAGLLRQLATGTFRRGVRTPTSDWALVVGDPPSGVPEFPRLPGAQHEAEEVAGRLTDRGWTVRPLIGSPPERVISALYSDAYRLIHLAAHGVFDPERPVSSGLVLEDGLRLTPVELSQMRQVPEMVFVNCCNLGRIDGLPEPAYRDRNRLAASFGVQLIEMGVRAVVVAGWVVDDAAAATFARVLYDQMLAGVAFGTAVRLARRETYLHHPGVNTWGAYQCYGDPDYRLVRGDGGETAEERNWVDPQRLVSELENLVSRALTGSDPAVLRRELEALERRIDERHSEWSGRFDVSRALGDAWGELAGAELLQDGETVDDTPRRPMLDALSRAIEHLGRAVGSGDGGVRLEAFQNLLYLRALRAASRFRAARDAARADSEPDRDAALEAARRLAEQEITAVLAEYEELAKALPSARTETGRGSVGKRLAEVRGTRADSRKALREAADALGRAYESFRAAPIARRFHATVNYATVRVLAELVDADKKGWNPPEKTQHLVAEAQQLSNSTGGGSFWSLQAVPEVSLLRLLWGRSRPGEVQEVEEPAKVADAFADALRHGSSTLQARTVLGNLACIAGILESRAGEGKTVEVAGERRLAPRVLAYSDVQSLRSALLDRLRKQTKRAV